MATIKQAHGLFIRNNRMYLTGVWEIYTVGINTDGSLGQPKMIISNLPDGGQHPNRTLAFRPDNKMYITVGSTCNACAEPSTMNATILHANEDGTNMVCMPKGCAIPLALAGILQPARCRAWIMGSTGLETTISSKN